MNFDLLVKNAIILSKANDYTPFIGTIGIIDSKIALVVQGDVSARSKEIIDGSGKILVPGLFNLHCHGDMTFARGFGDNLTLAQQNDKFRDTNWFYTLITDEDRFYSRQLTYCEALLSGTTFIVENMYWSLGFKAIEAIKAIGIKGALADDIRENFSKPQKLITNEHIDKFKKDCIDNGVIPMIGSISEEDFDIEYMKSIKSKIDYHDGYFTTHLAENDWRMDIVKNKFNQTPIEFLYENALLSDKYLGSHVVYANDKDIDILKKTKANVVNTPSCEMKIADGVAPVSKMVRAGVNVCLGTDGAMWNNTNNIIGEMKSTSLLQSITYGVQALSKKEVFDMATINGARALGLEKDLGSIEEGKRADFILVDYTGAHMTPTILGANENVLSNIIFNANIGDIRDVFIDGKAKVRNGALININFEYIKNKVLEAANKINDYYK